MRTSSSREFRSSASVHKERAEHLAECSVVLGDPATRVDP